MPTEKPGDVLDSLMSHLPPAQAREIRLVLNPNARKSRLHSQSIESLYESLQTRLGPTLRVEITRNLDELNQFMAQWTSGSAHAEVTLCFYGGDGSIARGLTSLIRQKGEDSVLPPILPIRAGTINMLCSILGVRENVEQTLERWNRQEFSELRVIPTLKVEVEGQPAQYGFIFAWGVGYRVLKDYYSRKHIPDVFDALSVMSSTFASALHPKAAQMPLFKAEEIDLHVEGERVHTLKNQKFSALTVGTISRVSLGIRPFSPEPIKPHHFHFSANSMSMLKVARHAPTLLFARGDQGELERKLQSELVSRTNVKEICCILNEGFTMDGEMFELNKPTKVKISAGPPVRFWIKSSNHLKSLKGSLE